MLVDLDPRLADVVREKVETGLYADADADLREALLLLDEHDRFRRLHVALAEGRRGDAVPLTPELLEELTQSSIRRANAGEQPNPEICPWTRRGGAMVGEVA